MPRGKRCYTAAKKTPSRQIAQSPNLVYHRRPHPFHTSVHSPLNINIHTHTEQSCLSPKLIFNKPHVQLVSYFALVTGMSTMTPFSPASTGAIFEISSTHSLPTVYIITKRVKLNKFLFAKPGTEGTSKLTRQAKRPDKEEGRDGGVKKRLSTSVLASKAGFAALSRDLLRLSLNS